MRRRQAFSLIELLMVISIIAILFGLLATSLAASKARSRQAVCVNNLHQIGLAFTGFSLDHEGKYPMDVPYRLGGSSEFNNEQIVTNTPFSKAFQHFAALSNEVPNVKIMTCPADRKRRPAANYQTFTNQHLSYWANPKAIPHATLTALAGDWNLPTNRPVHPGKGSVVFADGRVEITRTLAFDPPKTEAIAAAPPTKPNPQNSKSPGSQAPKYPTPPSETAKTKTPPTVNPGAPATRSGIQNVRPATPEMPKTNSTLVTNIPGQRQLTPSTRIRPTTSAPDLPPGSTPTTPVITAVPRSTAASDDPWDTPGFRLFKLLAIASYLFSLLLALVMLLILYLRSRMAARAKERAPSIE